MRYIDSIRSKRFSISKCSQKADEFLIEKSKLIKHHQLLVYAKIHKITTVGDTTTLETITNEDTYSQ